MLRLWMKCKRQTDGQNIIEYAILATFLSTCTLLILIGLNDDVNSVYRGVGKGVSASVPQQGPADPDSSDPGGGRPGRGRPGDNPGRGNPGGGNPGSGNPGNGNPGGGKPGRKN